MSRLLSRRKLRLLHDFNEQMEKRSQKLTVQASGRRDEQGMDNITVRRARAKDKEAVLRVNTNVYDGRDYLPAYYDHFLRSPNVLAAVMLYGDRIIAFAVGQILDNGESVAGRAGRINPTFEAKGLQNNLMRYILNWAVAKGVKRHVFTISDGVRHLSKPSFRNFNNYILTKQYPWYYFSGKGIMLTDTDISRASRLAPVSQSQLSIYFKSETVRDYISPEARMIVDAVPYKMIDENIPYMLQPEEFMAAYSDINVDSDKCSGLLSFGSVYPTPRPQYTYRLDIFGNDTDSLRTHIVKHLIRVKEKTTGVTAMLVYVSQLFDIEKVDSVFKEYEILRYPHSSSNSELKSRQIYAYEALELHTKL